MLPIWDITHAHSKFRKNESLKKIEKL
jgi:hypothetical protein